jgi:hypothetical protein
VPICETDTMVSDGAEATHGDGPGIVVPPPSGARWRLAIAAAVEVLWLGVLAWLAMR